MCMVVFSTRLFSCSYVHVHGCTRLFQCNSSLVSHTAKIKDYEYFMISQNDLQVHGYILLFQCNSSLVTTTASEIIMCMGVLILSLQHSSFLMSH